MSKLISILIFTLILASCSGSGNIGQFKNMDVDGWNYGDTVFFDVIAPDSVFFGDITLTVRNSSAYDYSNLWLEISYPEGDSVVCDTINFRLADESGNWLGKGLGLSFQKTDSVLKNVKMEIPAKIGLRHIMRVDRLEGIEQLGLIYIPQQ